MYLIEHYIPRISSKFHNTHKKYDNSRHSNMEKVSSFGNIQGTVFVINGSNSQIDPAHPIFLLDYLM